MSPQADRMSAGQDISACLLPNGHSLVAKARLWNNPQFPQTNPAFLWPVPCQQGISPCLIGVLAHSQLVLSIEMSFDVKGKDEGSMLSTDMSKKSSFPVMEFPNLIALISAPNLSLRPFAIPKP